MDQQGKADILDFSVPTSWSGSLLMNMDEHSLRRQAQNYKGSVINGNGMTLEELQIRHELEIDIERDLEEEIKDRIYHLALRLHRLYQHKMERNAKDHESEHRAKFAKEEKKKMVSEININIKMEGGTKVEIKESKKEASEKSRPRSFKPENMQSSNKKFDWVNTLRSSSSTSTSTSAGQVRNPNHVSKQQRGNATTDKDLNEMGWKY
ncbi:uncharacterized protein LOC107410149 isoform X2 [Ziziphus jujuba]|uniref:Uncharacterized protein LOC107410149 isoform X2 n=1 Tax=Ziziphus jujuba TaxID=326968 RepID=A0A6P3ZE40_ZIZJJ|nr:uncharacterized protein LOC107410149 isoform X2 [Ziziphus jujuba]